MSNPPYNEPPEQRLGREGTQCSRTKQNGERCKAPRLKGRKLCRFHAMIEDDPASLRERAAKATAAHVQKIRERKEKEAREKRAIKNPADAKRLLGLLVSEMRVAHANAKDVASVVAIFLKAHEQEVEQETIGKINAIYEQVEQMKLARRGTGITGDWPSEPVSKEDDDAELAN